MSRWGKLGEKLKRGLKRRSPWQAALLNFMIWGAGFIYAGRRLCLGASLLFFLAALLFGGSIAASGHLYEAVGLVLLSWLSLGLALAREAYLEVRGGNERTKERAQE